MRFSLAIAISVVAAVVSAPAFAGVLVVNQGLGRECYVATLLPPDRLRDAENLQVCDLAITTNISGAHDLAANYINRSDLKLRQNDYAGALSDAEKGLALEANLGEAYVNRGAGMLGLRRCEDALPVLDQAIQLKGDQLPVAYFDRAVAKECLGDVKGAYLDYKKTVALAPNFQPAIEQLQRFSVTTQ